MTITVHAGTTSQSTASSSSIAVTIPAGANFVYVIVSGYIGAGTYSPLAFFTALNWDNSANVDFTYIERNAFASNDWQIEAMRIDSSSPAWPGTGSKTLYYTARNAPSEGLNIYVGAMTGADTAASIVSSGVSTPGNSAASSKTITLSGVGANDATVVAQYGYQADAPNTAPGGSNQTLLWQSSVLANASLGVAYEIGEGSPVISNNGNDGMCGVAFAVKDSGGAAPSSTICLVSDVRRQPMLRGPY